MRISMGGQSSPIGSAFSRLVAAFSAPGGQSPLQAAHQQAQIDYLNARQQSEIQKAGIDRAQAMDLSQLGRLFQMAPEIQADAQAPVVDPGVGGPARAAAAGAAEGIRAPARADLAALPSRAAAYGVGAGFKPDQIGDLFRVILANYGGSDPQLARAVVGAGGMIGENQAVSLADRESVAARNQAGEIAQIFAKPVQTSAGARTDFADGRPTVFGSPTESTAKGGLVTTLAGGGAIPPDARALLFGDRGFSLTPGQGRYDENGNLVAERANRPGAASVKAVQDAQSPTGWSFADVATGEVKLRGAPPPPDSGFSLSPGQTRYDATGNPIASVDPRPQAPSFHAVQDAQSPTGWSYADVTTGAITTRGAPPPADRGFSLSPGQTRYDAAGNPVASVAPVQQPFSLSPGQTRYDAAGNPVASVAPRETGQPFNVVADGQNYLTRDGVTTVDGQPIPPGGTRVGLVANTFGDAGLAKPVVADLQRGQVDVARFSATLDQLEQVAKTDPSLFGAVGEARRLGQNIAGQASALGQFFGAERFNQVAADLQQRGVAPEFFDPNLSDIEKLATLAAYQAAAALGEQSGRGLSDKDFVQFRRIIGDPTAWLSTQESFLAGLSRVRALVNSQFEVSRNALGGAVPGTQPAQAGGVASVFSGQPAPAAPAAADPLGIR